MSALALKNLLNILDDYIFGPLNLGMLLKPPATNGDNVIKGSIWSDTIDGKGGNDAIYANCGNDKVNGGDGNDKLFGEQGNDTLAGGRGNDCIDGGADSDLAVFTGTRSQYQFVHNGDGSVSVVDLVANRDGTDILKNVESVKFGNGQVFSLEQLALPQTVLNATLDVTATNGNGYWLNGNGIPANGVIQQDSGHFENSQMFTFRTGDTIQPTSVKPDGTVVFTGPDGPQVIDPAHNVSTAHAGRGAIAIGWEFNTGANGPGGMTQQQFLQAGGREIVRLDLDPTANVKYLEMELKYDPIANPNGSHTVLVASNNLFAAQGITAGTVIANDNGGNLYAAENFTNLAFFNNLIDHDPNTAGIQGGAIAPAGEYDFETQMIGVTGTTITHVHSELLLV